METDRLVGASLTEEDPAELLAGTRRRATLLKATTRLAVVSPIFRP